MGSLEYNEVKQNIIEKVQFSALKVDNYLHNVKLFYEQQPFFYDKAGIFWFWIASEYRWERVDETDIMIGLEKQLRFQGQTISNNIKAQYIEAIKRIGRENKPKDAPVRWIQFKDRAYSLRSGKVYYVTPEYFFTNPIPWEIGETTDTPVMDKLFTEWVGEKYKDTLYEMIAYACYRKYPISHIFTLVGCGCNGKTKYLTIIKNFIGAENVCSTELDTLIDSRFESAKLFKKLVCLMGETNFGILKKSSILKKLTGEDQIGFEFKNKTPFDDTNYAKIFIASNSLPSSMDTSDGFYRRWLILDFPNTFQEGKDILQTIPSNEYNNLARKVIQILPLLLGTGQFTNQGTIEERRKKFILSSNPLSFFIDALCEKDDESFISYNELYNAYVLFLHRFKKRKVLRKEFKGALEDLGYYVEKNSKKVGDGEFKNTWWIDGLRLYNFSDETEKRKFWDIWDNMPEFLTQISMYRKKLKKTAHCPKSPKTFVKTEPTYLKCAYCGDSPTVWEHVDSGKKLCNACKGTLEINEEVII